MAGLSRNVARRIARLEREREAAMAPQLRDRAARKLRSKMDQFNADELGEIIAAESERSAGEAPTITDAYLRWEEIGGCAAWDALQHLVKLLEEQGALGDWNVLDSLGITATRERAHIAMGYLDRRYERLRELEEGS